MTWQHLLGHTLHQTGAANWWPPCFNPNTGLFYQVAYDGGAKYFIDRDVVYEPGKPFGGGGADRDGFFTTNSDPSFISAVRAMGRRRIRP